eukprot:789981_1
MAMEEWVYSSRTLLELLKWTQKKPSKEVLSNKVVMKQTYNTKKAPDQITLLNDILELFTANKDDIHRNREMEMPQNKRMRKRMANNVQKSTLLDVEMKGTQQNVLCLSLFFLHVLFFISYNLFIIYSKSAVSVFISD